jgi:DNA-binding NtrC family response regulator/predicted TIM-barrel enzyme
MVTLSETSTHLFGLDLRMTGFLQQLDRRNPALAVVVGSGQTAKAAATAGADLLLVLNAGLYRNLGCGSLAAFLPYGNANRQTETLLEGILPQAGNVPVVAGVFGSDPTTDIGELLDRLEKLGVAGVTNWPSLGFVDGQFREALDEEGFTSDSELAMLSMARARGLATVGFVHNPSDAKRFALESDALILNVGLTHEVDDRQDRRDQLQTVAVRLNRMLAAARQPSHPPPVCFCFGGPMTTADDFEMVARQCAIDGFAGGSVFDRLPIRRAMESTVRQFKGISLAGADRAEPEQLGQLLGRSHVMRSLMETVRRVARYNVNVCIEGNTGTGKELVATQLHRLSPRSNEPFITLNCGAIAETLIESELFGYEQGAFTGANRRRAGKFELADRGTLFLDEVADLSARAQVALLRAIQEGEVVRVGGDKPIRVDVRVVTATHQSLERLVAEGKFRADLYFRLNQVHVRIPSLAERRDDIPMLVDEILNRLRGRLGRELSSVTSGFRDKLLAYDWPGNVRELEHVICRAAILEDGSELSGESFRPYEATSASPASATMEASMLQTRRRRAEEAIRRAMGNKSHAAEMLKISRKTLYTWLNE